MTAPRPATRTGPLVPLHPGPTTAAASERMQRLQRRDTRPELAVRSLLHGRGLRYRVVYPVPGKPRRSIDIAFPRLRLAVFIDGCFWHGCAAHGGVPVSNRTWWTTKLARTAERDRETNDILRTAGWTVLRFWEHDEPGRVVDEVERLAGAPRPSARVRRLLDDAR